MYTWEILGSRLAMSLANQRSTTSCQSVVHRRRDTVKVTDLAKTLSGFHKEVRHAEHACCCGDHIETAEVSYAVPGTRRQERVQ